MYCYKIKRFSDNEFSGYCDSTSFLLFGWYASTKTGHIVNVYIMFHNLTNRWHCVMSAFSPFFYFYNREIIYVHKSSHNIRNRCNIETSKPLRPNKSMQRLSWDEMCLESIISLCKPHPILFGVLYTWIYYV